MIEKNSTLKALDKSVQEATEVNEKSNDFDVISKISSEDEFEEAGFIDEEEFVTVSNPEDDKKKIPKKTNSHVNNSEDDNDLPDETIPYSLYKKMKNIEETIKCIESNKSNAAANREINAKKKNLKFEQLEIEKLFNAWAKDANSKIVVINNSKLTEDIPLPNISIPKFTDINTNFVEEY
ncbi:hypothetical protein P9705_001271 [Enterococcus faecalis]|nr:hypothetical protein [Enterococcus faecalis]